MEEGAISQGHEWPIKDEKAKKVDFFPKPLFKNTGLPNLVLAHWDQCHAFDLKNCKILNLFCLKSLNL